MHIRSYVNCWVQLFGENWMNGILYTKLRVRAHLAIIKYYLFKKKTYHSLIGCVHIWMLDVRNAFFLNSPGWHEIWILIPDLRSWFEIRVFFSKHFQSLFATWRLPNHFEQECHLSINEINFLTKNPHNFGNPACK